MKSIKAVVVDDEESNRDLIIQLISGLGTGFAVIGQADGVKSAYRLISELNPQVVFLDIKMPDGSGFSLLNMFPKLNFEVVFISGFDKYALQAFEFNALDYILKPIDPEKFALNLQKVYNRIIRIGLHAEELETLLPSYDPSQLIISKIPVHSGNKVILLSIEDIVHATANEGCTEFKTSSGEKYISSKRLSDLEFIFDNYPNIVHINRGTYINLQHLLSYSKGINCFLTMRDGAEFDISRRKKAEILELLAARSHS